MYQADAQYIRQLAKDLKLKTIKPLDSVMGPNELKKLLSTTNAADFLGPRPWINLHTHSTASDGTLSPVQWLENVRKWKEENHLQQLIVALTDHDTMAGLIPVLKHLIKSPNRFQGIRLILGVELSCAIEDNQLKHPLDFEILHYGVNPFDTEYIHLLKKQAENRKHQLPLIFQELNEKYPKLGINLHTFYHSPFYGHNIRKGLGVNWLYNTMSYLRSIIQTPWINPADVQETLLAFGEQKQGRQMWQNAATLLSFIRKKQGLVSLAHPYRLQLEGKLKTDVRTFIPHFLQVLHKNGLNAVELYYGNMGNMQSSLEKVQTHQPPQTETDNWVQLIYQTATSLFKFATGGSDNHEAYLGNGQYKQKYLTWQKLMTYWHQSQKWIQKGYKILDKEVTMGLPGACMPAYDPRFDLGIGTPYGQGAKRVWQFWDKAVHKILLAPVGQTFKKTGYSPYMSDDTRINPHFLPPETIIQKDIDWLSFKTTATETARIHFDKVEKNFQCLYKKTTLTQNQMDKKLTALKETNKYPYIADIPICPNTKLVQKKPDLFLKNFTLGTPPDALSNKPRNWGFPVFNPDKLWAGQGLGQAGKIWQRQIDSTLKGAKGGMRIDHFIAFVNPYVIATDPKNESGRLYSSPTHPILKKYAFKTIDQFYKITKKIVWPILKKYHLSEWDLYPEDIGVRPPQLDAVLNHFKLGRLVVAQFKNQNQPDHMYQLGTTKKQDIAALDTHDTPSIQMFFDALDDKARYQHAQALVQSLRFHYTDDLKTTQALTRMQWAELLTCPAKRVQAFFTSWIGQTGRYNEPGKPNKWQLRCVADFDELYFKNLAQGLAYNPLDAIALAIYARGDDFYQKHQELVAQLNTANAQLHKLIHNWMNS